MNAEKLFSELMEGNAKNVTRNNVDYMFLESDAPEIMFFAEVVEGK